MKRAIETRRSGLLTYLSTKPTLRTEVLFLVPLGVVYHVGARFTGVYNGVDLVSVLLAYLNHVWRWGVWMLEGILSIGFVVLYLDAKQEEHFEWRHIWRPMAEAAVYAMSMGAVVVLILTRLFGLEPRVAGGHAHGVLGALQVAAGAGFYEELFFRLGLYGGMVWGLSRRWSPWLSRTTALVVSSLLFALAHHLPGGEPIALWPVAYRTVSGMFLAVLYEWRGLAVAAYAHAFYDVLVLAGPA